MLGSKFWQPHTFCPATGLLTLAPAGDVVVIMEPTAVVVITLELDPAAVGGAETYLTVCPDKWFCISFCVDNSWPFWPMMNWPCGVLIILPASAAACDPCKTWPFCVSTILPEGRAAEALVGALISIGFPFCMINCWPLGSICPGLTICWIIRCWGRTVAAPGPASCWVGLLRTCWIIVGRSAGLPLLDTVDCTVLVKGEETDGNPWMLPATSCCCSLDCGCWVPVG